MERLFWIDMEMTGLDPAKEVIIEVAALITDLNFNVLDSFDAVIQQDQKYLDQMDEWNQKHHGASGLTAKVPSGTPQKQVEASLIELVKKYFPDPKNRPVIAGNSIGQDRSFINIYMPQFAALLHYRMLDVSSWKIIMNHKYKIEHKKKDQHRALDDIHESIEELKTYLQFMKVP